jgi:prefoldin subunit 5
MPSRMSDAELLEQTAEWLSRLAETIERVTERLADSISKLQAEQERQGDALRALAQRVETIAPGVTAYDRKINAEADH